MPDIIGKCGHNCSRCKVYISTQTGDAAMRGEVIAFYKNIMNRNLSDAEIRCCGCGSDVMMAACAGCPFTKCCGEKEIESCLACPSPCDTYTIYRNRYVNKVLQV